MTTRPGQPERPPNARSVSRSLSTTNVTQRPAPHRSLSQQFPSSSPTRRTTNEGFVDLTLDGPDSVMGRTIPRSRLNLEIGKGSKAEDVVESPKPTSDLTPTWKPSQPPRGRPLLHFDVPSVSNLSPRAAQERGQNEATIKPMPLPVRPGQHAPPTTAEKVRSAPSNLGRKDARPKPYVLEVPSAAPRYSPNGHADFYPWTGNHPEDQFSEPVIRHGYYDKAQMTQNETGSARHSIFPALKHKSGLQTLSSLFTSVMAQRRSHGQITTTSTFKPPPRVTVTDTKREMWLKDLANPTIPLRRLSRSIPHGIRGKVLLDQSLSKNIPIERAVWLAKCVGANELRSFRRKGASGTFAMGGEAKWIRDFTVCVEQFLETIVGTCGEKDFKIRVNYAIRLATHFHAEYLLDREHYMDWLVSSLESSPQAKLPMWLLITQIYWKDLLQYRKYGRRLSAALLNHLDEAFNHPDRDILAPLSDRLRLLLKGIINSSPDNFVSPNIWSKHEELIRTNLAPDDERFVSLLADINQRNRRLTWSGKEEELNSRRRLIKLLDATILNPLPNEMPQKCWEIDGDKVMLARAVLEWSTSSHRPGIEKTYVAARILRVWSKAGADITDTVLDFIESEACESRRSKAAFYHLVSELARSGHFSTARYVQWLIARGGLYDANDVADSGRCATRLLAELPTHNLSDSIAGLRATLLSRAEYLVDEEEEQTKACMACMNRALPGMQGNVDPELESYDLPISRSVVDLISGASRTSKSEIGLWLRHKVKLQMLQPTIPPLDDWDDSPVKSGTSAITVSDFNTVRHYLDMIDDYSMLADVLKIVSSSNDAEVLASCADTVNLYLNTFAAIGALKSLFDALMARIRSLTEELDSIPRVFLVSLSDLASRLPEQKIVAQQLCQELARSDRKTAADACSPVSDHMALMQTAESDFTDEIEKVLASGNSMDQATLERLFQRIILRLEESFDKSPEQQRSCGLLLTRLKTFDTEQFNVLMNTWVTRFLQLKSRPSMVQILGPLISFGCLALPDVITALGLTLAKGPTSMTSQEALALILASSNVPDAMSVEEACRLRIKQAHMQKDHPRDILHVIRRAVEGTLASGSSQNEGGLLGSQAMHELLQRLVLVDTDLVIRELVIPLLKTTRPQVLSAINSIVDRLLLGHNSKSQITTEVILSLADDLTLPFCQVKLASMFNTDDSVMSGTDDGPSEHLEAFDNAIESAVTAGRTTWATIVPLLDVSIAKHLRQRTETQFLASFPSPKTVNTYDSVSMQNRIVHAKNLLHIVDATAYSISDEPSAPNQSNPGTEIATALNNIWLILSTSQVQTTKEAIITSWLPLLLSFITIHKKTFDVTKSGHEHRAKTILALAAISLELESLDTGSEATVALIEQIFDLALYLVDSLHDDVRLQCIKSLRDTPSSPRIRYLFSFANNPSEWLVLSQRDRLLSGMLGSSTSKVGGSGAEGKASEKEKPVPFPLRRWEMLGEPTPNVGENDTSLSLTLFGARRG